MNLPPNWLEGKPLFLFRESFEEKLYPHLNCKDKTI